MNRFTIYSPWRCNSVTTKSVRCLLLAQLYLTKYMITWLMFSTCNRIRSSLPLHVLGHQVSKMNRRLQTGRTLEILNHPCFVLKLSSLYTHFFLNHRVSSRTWGHTYLITVSRITRITKVRYLDGLVQSKSPNFVSIVLQWIQLVKLGHKKPL